MGRYYSGDIDGKFWFGVQSSDAADRFGRIGEQPPYLVYYFDIDDLPEVEAEIQRIESTLGEKKAKLDAFFNQEGKLGYQDKELTEIGISQEDLSEYADLFLGYKIAKALKESESGTCEFTAEF
jgi:hypothetical protein